MSQLHERLDKKEDALLEKQLILEEIASLSDRLRFQAADGRQDTLELAQKVQVLEDPCDLSHVIKHPLPRLPNMNRVTDQ